MNISFVILTYKRKSDVVRLLGELEALVDDGHEVVVVDNASNDGTAEHIAYAFPWVNLVPLPENVGVAGRNRGYEAARGDLIISLDDDMCDFQPASLEYLKKRFQSNPKLAGICFKVTWPGTDRVRDWVHRRPPEHAGSIFPTYEITEGAVAWRKSAIQQTNYYREDFFISHEGVELAYRLLNNGWQIEYDGSVAIGHNHAAGGRPSWRRYYYDTRNLIWLAILHQPVRYAFRYLSIGLGSMFVYSLRDGFGLVWLMAIKDAVFAAPSYFRERKVWEKETKLIVNEADTWRVAFFKMVKKRIMDHEFSLE